jgi:hypothetical protein
MHHSAGIQFVELGDDERLGPRHAGGCDDIAGYIAGLAVTARRTPEHLLELESVPDPELAKLAGLNLTER